MNSVTTWKSPSNIALIKYWGKKAGQIPANASLSFTLDACHTITTVRWEQVRASNQPFDFTIKVEGQESEAFRPKIEVFLQRASDLLPFLPNIRMEIETRNSFPHSSGIASSASGLSALALCLGDIAGQLTGGMADFERFCSILSRLGSGSACRSVYGGLVTWGDHPGITGSSDHFAIPYPHKIHPVFTTYRDTVLLVEVGQKSVSSSRGHELMNQHPFGEARIAQAGTNMKAIVQSIAGGNVFAFGDLVESEALTLHALMMTSRPGYLLMRPNTLEVLERVRRFREEEEVPLHFTLDAGANVHLLYPEEWEEKVHTFVASDLASFCKEGRYIHDRVGSGPQRMEHE